jgi:hypothetical protein
VLAQEDNVLGTGWTPGRNLRTVQINFRGSRGRSDADPGETAIAGSNLSHPRNSEPPIQLIKRSHFLSQS